jgi:heptosyltransferase-3
MAKQNKILIYRLGSLGDTVVALPCFHLIARAYPDSVRFLLTNAPSHAKAPAASAILDHSGLVHGYINYYEGTRSVLELGRLWWEIRKSRIDTVVYLTPPRGEAAIKRDEVFFRMCGVKEIIGTPRGDLAKYRYDPAHDRHEAEASRLARCLAEIGDARLSDPASWDLRLTPAEHERAADFLRPLHGKQFIVLGIGSKKDVTDWGVENWKSLMPRLREKFSEYAIVFIGAKEDRQAADLVAAGWSGKSLNASGDLSPRESAALIQRAHMYLGPDSGPMHLAASVGTPCVSIFAAHQRPGKWFPFGQAHEVIYHKTDCFDCNLTVCTVEKKKCILSISTGEVLAAAERAGKREVAAVNGFAQ